MSSIFVILPVHLFHHDILIENIKLIQPLVSKIIILEEPAYFGNHYITMNYNKLKLIYHRATMKYYKDYISKHLPSNIELEYIEYKELKNLTGKTSGYARIKKGSSNIKLFNPIDTFIEAKYKKIFGSKIDFLETPSFLCTSKDLATYDSTKTTKKSYYHASFYTWQRSRMNILSGSKTYDTENRNMMPLSVKVPPLPDNDSHITNTRQYLNEAIEFVQKTWPQNLEPIYVQKNEKTITPESIHFPITHQTAEKWVHNFCKMRFALFGKYEDSIDSVPRNFLFHSCITPMLNIGLLTPQQVVNIVSDYYNKHKTKIGIANYEGFIRQLIGWREYQRYIYQYAGEKMRTSNYFNNSRRLNQSWYNATTGIKPVDDAMQMAINDGYIHHILRLMVVGNFMNLVGIHPDDVYKWFMEFSLDSYDWVMVGNVYSMALWADGGLTMRKPYISGDGYIMKMSNYVNDNKNQEKDKEWNTKWNSIFHHFIDRNSIQLKTTYYNGLVKAWNNKNEQNKKQELELANEIIKKISN